MLRKLYGLDAQLASPISRTSKELTLLPGHGVVLAYDDWAYAILEEGTNTEVVWLYAQDGDSFYILRAQDGTTAVVFSNPTIRYVLTAQEIRETTPVIELFFISSDNLEIFDGTIYVALVTIEYTGVHYSFGSDGTIHIGREEDAYGCCGADNGVGVFEFGIYYLTSTLYPIETSDGIGVSPSISGVSLAGKRIDGGTTESMGVSSSIAAIVLRTQPTMYPVEAIDLTSSVTVQLKEQPQLYPTDQMDVQSSADVFMRRVVVSNNALESIDVFSGIQGVSMYAN